MHLWTKSLIRPSNQHGFTLTELLIGLALTGIISIAGLQTFLFIHQAWQVHKQGIEMEKAANDVFYLFNHLTGQAGFNLEGDSQALLFANHAIENKQCEDGKTLIKRDITLLGKHSQSGRNDAVLFSSNAAVDMLEKDCTGARLKTPCASLATPFKIYNYVYRSSKRRLLCRGSLSAVAQPFAEHVERLKLRYLVRHGMLSTWLSAEQVDALIATQQHDNSTYAHSDAGHSYSSVSEASITHLQVAVIIRSPNGYLRPKQRFQFEVFDETIKLYKSAHSYRLFQQVFPLLNPSALYITPASINVSSSAESSAATINQSFENEE